MKENETGHSPEYYQPHFLEIEEMTMADMYLKLLQDAITQLDGPEDDRQERLRKGFPLVSSGRTRGDGAMALETGARGENRARLSGNVIRVDFRKS